MPAPQGHEPYNKNGEGGRPKIYTEDFINNEAQELEIWMKDKNNLFIEDFCLERGYHESRITEFVQINDRFSLAYSMLKMKQKTALFKGSLTRRFAHPMCALLLSHSHNIHLKTEQKLSGSATDPLSFVLDRIDGKSKEFVDET